MKKSHFKLGDKLGYVSPFEESPFRKEWAERRERREERREYYKKQELTQRQNKDGLPEGGLHFVLNGIDIAVKNNGGYYYSKEVPQSQLKTAKYFISSYKKAEQYLRKSTKATEILNYLEGQTENILVQYSEDRSGSYTGLLIGTSWNPFLWSIVDEYKVNYPAMILMHELYHQYNDLIESDEKGKTLWTKNQEMPHLADHFGVEDEYLTTMFVNEVIKEGGGYLINRERPTRILGTLEYGGHLRGKLLLVHMILLRIKQMPKELII